MYPLQLDAVANAVDVAAIATTALRFVAGFLAVLLLGKLVLIPGLRRVVRSRGFDEAVLSLGTNVLNAVIWVAAIAIGFAVAGYGSFLSAFAVFGGAIALAVGFAAQDLLGNFVAGVFILKDKPFAVGDWIEWDGKDGVVREIQMRVTKLDTFDNELVTVPNSDLANAAVVNNVANDQRRVSVGFGIGYDDDVDQARDAIVEEGARVDGVLEDPEPTAPVTELGDSAVVLSGRIWIDPSESSYGVIRSQFVETVKERFDAEGIDIPYHNTELSGGIEVTNDSSGEGAATGD